MLRLWCAAMVVLFWAPAPANGESGLYSAKQDLASALAGTHAVAVALDGQTGRLVAAVRAEEAGRLVSAPGSTLKPFFLMAALRQGRIQQETTVVCHGDLRIAGRDVACTHPRQENVLDAERALAYSCNIWFASLATRFAPGEATNVLRTYGFGSRTGLLAGEAAGAVDVPHNRAELQLLVLGLDDVEATPVQMARAYFRLGQQLDREPVVQRGLEGAVVYGMAHRAATASLRVAGKTGTASNVGESWTHGWFAGIAERGARRIVIVVYAPRGNGADAAGLAHRFFLRWGRMK